ncbi:MAG: SGNH/GDSL hydrolase family protein [Dehalococcoidia bacterium]|jgi:lysophospholipase L1-like esterase
MGDSFATGLGASKSNLGYVPLFYSFLHDKTKHDMTLVSEAVVGETTTSAIATGQLGKALAELRFRNQDKDPTNDVTVITLDLGINDIDSLVLADQPCAPPIAPSNPGCVSAANAKVTAAEENLTAILHTVRVAAGPDVKMFALNCFNSYSGTGLPIEAMQDMLVTLINQKIAAVAALPGVDANVIDAYDAFKGKGQELTAVGGPSSDFHPNDAGYRVLADLLESAYNGS